MLAESAPFPVTPKSTTPPSISTDKSSYKVFETITVTYAGLPGNQYDVIRLAFSTDADSSSRYAVVTNGQMSGTATFQAQSPVSGGACPRQFDERRHRAQRRVHGIELDATTTRAVTRRRFRDI